jgi:hypothetical protein
MAKTKKKFLIKDEGNIFTVPVDYFDDIETRDEALLLALLAIDELHTTLKDEALEDDVIFVGNMKVTTGLQRSLEELNKRWPKLLDQVYSTPRSIEGRVITFS